MGIEARAVVVAIVTPTAPATCTFFFSPPSPVASADEPWLWSSGAAPPLSVARVPAASFCFFTLVSTPPSVSVWLPEAGASSTPPATLALALALLPDTVRALKLTLPPALMSRCVVASAESVAMVSASEMPTPVSPDSVSPVASVMAEPWWAALSATSPELWMAGNENVPRLASVLFSDTETAIDGVTAVLPLLPAAAALVSALLDEAESLMSEAPVIDASSPMCAKVSVMPTLTLMAAPTPILPPPSCLPVALVALATKFSALSSTPPPSRSVNNA